MLSVNRNLFMIALLLPSWHPMCKFCCIIQAAESSPAAEEDWLMLCQSEPLSDWTVLTGTPI